MARAQFVRAIRVQSKSTAPARAKQRTAPVIYVPSVVDVRKIRERTGKSQPVFAASIGVPVSTVRQWELGRRRPEKAARVLLALLQRNPWLVEEMLTVPHEPEPFSIPSSCTMPLPSSTGTTQASEVGAIRTRAEA